MMDNDDRDDKDCELTEQEVILIGDLAKAGKLPLKLVTGRQTTGPFKIMPGAIVAEAGATVIFVCG